MKNARLIKSHPHTNIVNILSVAESMVWLDGHPANFVQMEMWEMSLEFYIHDLKRTRKKITLSEYFDILIDVLSGIVFVHENNWVHIVIQAGNSKDSNYVKADLKFVGKRMVLGH